ncbi:MAG: thermonuclease family protein [bacterium]|nr:thermonuclease family protein [bacterium]
MTTSHWKPSLGLVANLAFFFLGFGLGGMIFSQPQNVAESLPSPEPSVHPKREDAMVTRVIDGDTIELSDGRRVRYIGMDTPETVDPRQGVECYGKEAAEENSRIVLGKKILLEKDVTDVDRFGRYLRYVYVGDIMANESLVRNGYASVSTFPPDVRYQSLFIESEREAQENGRGLWSGCRDATPTPTLFGASSLDVESDQRVGSNCQIKGNISANGEKIYHLPGCGSYDKTNIDESLGERWFCTEDEAKDSGWRKAKNCS